jgi:hypothetical protein
MLIKLVENKAHTVHETVHVCGFSLVVGRAFMCGESSLESFEVLHPLDREIMWLDVGFVEDQNEREFRLVQNTTQWHRHCSAIAEARHGLTQLTYRRIAC